MLPKVLGDYGGPFIDEKPVEDPETQLSAAKGNRCFEDLAQLTRTATRAIVRFETVSSGNPTTVSHVSVWGSGDAQKPTVARVATGRYSITYATSFTDSLSVVESVSFVFASSALLGTVAATTQIESISSNVVTVRVYVSGSLADAVGDEVMVWLR